MSQENKQLSDNDMIIILHDIARAFARNDAKTAEDIRQIADRLTQLANAAATRRHWTGHE